MSSTPAGPEFPGKRLPQLVLLLLAIVVVAVVWLEGGRSEGDLLDQMARRSLPLEQALANGRPTVVEFYADWCESCRTMAPGMEQMVEDHPQVDLVLLNVDNPSWQPQVQRWNVNGIPHLQLFDANGESRGQSIGLRQPQELSAIAVALETGEPLPSLAGIGAISSLDPTDEPSRRDISSNVGPRSHG